MSFGKAVAVGTIAIVLAGCGNPTEGELWGSGAGAVAGGGIGRAVAIGTHYPVALTGAGLIAGAALGYALGEYVDPPAQRMWAAATVAAAEAGRPGEPVAWETHGHKGAVTMVGEGWTDAGGRLCRALRQQASRLSESDPPFVRDVVACRAVDGTWEVAAPHKDPEPPAPES